MGFISTVFCRKRCICLVIPCIILGVVTWFAIFHRELAFLRATFNPKYQKNADETVVSPNDTENHKTDFEYRDDSFREHDLFRDKNSDSDYNDDYDHGLILEHEGGHHDDQDYHGNDYHGNDHNTGLSDNDNDDGNHDDENHSENGNEMENDPEQENGNDNDSGDNSDHDHEHNEHLSNSDENENNSDNENDDANHSDNENSENNQSGNNNGGDNTSDNEGHSDNFHGNEHGNDGDSHSNQQEHDHNNDDDDHGNEHGTDGDSHSNDENEHNNDDDDHSNEHGTDGDSHSNDGDSHSNDQNEHDNDDDDHGNEHGSDGDSHSNDQNQHNNDDDDADSDSFPDIFGLERSDDFIDIETENNHIIETLPDIEKHSYSMNTANDAINNILDSALDKVNQHKHPDDQENRAPPASVTPSPKNTVGGGEALDAHMSIQKVSINDEVMKAEQLKGQTIDVSTTSIRAPSAQTKSTTTPPGKLDDKQLTIDDLISSLIDEKGDDNASTVSTTTKPHTNTQIDDVIKGITDATTKQPNTPNRKQEITAARIQSSTPTPSDTPLHFTIADDKQPDPNVHNLNDRHEVVDPLRDDTSEENDKKESITFEKNENN